MRSSVDTKHVFSHVYLSLTMLSFFSPLSSCSPSSSFCELQAQFDLNRIFKAGDFVLGGLFYIHSSAVFPELSFTSKQLDPTCYG